MATIISRENAEAIIREQVIQSIFQDTPKQSAFMSLAKKLPNMTSKQTRIRVLDLLPMAYWVDGDTGMKQTSRQAWDNVYLTAAELAVIVPIPEAVLDDAEFDIFGEVTPRVNEAIGQRVDGAIMFGVNRPSEWQNDIVTLARQAGNNVSAPTSGDQYFDKLLGEGGLFSKVEAYGYDVSGVVSAKTMKASLRGIKDGIGRPIFSTNMQGSTAYALDGVPMVFPDNGAFDSSIAQMIVGDFSQAVYAIRQDIQVKILDQGVIQDPATNDIVYNLAQQDMIALRVTFRMGWAVPNPVSRLNENRIGCAFAYLEPSSPVATKTVTFTVIDSVGAVEGASIDVNGSKLLTNAGGQAVFNLRAGTYPAKIKKAGYSTVNDTVTVASSDVTKSVSLNLSGH